MPYIDSRDVLIMLGVLVGVSGVLLAYLVGWGQGYFSEWHENKKGKSGKHADK